MSEYIKRNVAIDWIEKTISNNQDGELKVYSQGVRDGLYLARENIKLIPAADVCHVVLCRDCKYYYAYPDEYRTCHEFYEADGVSKMMSVTDFCSHGERKDEADMRNQEGDTP